MSSNVSFIGVDRRELADTLAAGIDHGGNPIEPFVDDAGGWPLRCCLADSIPGDRIAIIAWSPFDWSGPYRETGPIVVHTDGCAGPVAVDSLPDVLDLAPMVLRPYNRDRRIAYEHVRHVDAGGSLSEGVLELLSIDEVDLVHGRNVRGGCFAFSARLT